MSIDHHARAPNSGGRTPGSQTPGVTATPGPRAITAVSARGLKNGRSSPRRTSAKNGVTTAITPPIHCHIRHRLRMPGTLSLRDHRDVQPLSMNCNCGDLRSFCTVTTNKKRRFSQRAATVRFRLSPPRRHLRNLHDMYTRDVDHLIHEGPCPC